MKKFFSFFSSEHFFSQKFIFCENNIFDRKNSNKKFFTIFLEEKEIFSFDLEIPADAKHDLLDNHQKGFSPKHHFRPEK